MTPAKVRLAAAAMGKPETKITDLCAGLGVSSKRFIVTSRLLGVSGRKPRKCYVPNLPRSPGSPPTP